VMENGAAQPESQMRAAASQPASTAPSPSMEELRQLLQLRQEMGAMYQQAGSTQNEAQQAPQQ